MFQFNHLGIGKNLFIAQNISYISAPEFVDGLIVVAHHAQILIFGGQKADKLKLCSIGILVFIHHQIPEPFLVRLQHVGAGLEKFHGLYNEIIKVKSIVLFQLLLVFLVGKGNLFLSEIPHSVELIFLRAYELILCGGDGAHNRPLFVNFCINIQPLADILHQGLLVIGVIDCKIIAVSQAVNVSSQDSHTAGMKGTHPDALGAEAHQLVHTVPHLLRSFIGKGDRHDIPRVDSLFFYQVRNPVRQHSGLAGTCSRQDQHRPLCPKNRLLLLAVQCIVYTHMHSPSILIIHPAKQAIFIIAQPPPEIQKFRGIPIAAGQKARGILWIFVLPLFLPLQKPADVCLHIPEGFLLTDLPLQNPLNLFGNQRGIDIILPPAFVQYLRHKTLFTLFIAL